ncbi:EIN3-binding F-box protein 1 [Nymphaea thermarum]|nr:EIN3-binding F-box protein 1 [Nymphaea thermarum]
MNMAGSEPASRRKRARVMKRRGCEEDEGKSHENPFDRLPEECILKIFSCNPDPSDRWSCAAVSKKWLNLQAQMKSSDFKLEPPIPCRAATRFSRCLEGCSSVDTRLAAMVVAKFWRGKITSLSIRADSLDCSSDPHGVLTDHGLRIVGSSFPYLKSLALWGCLQVTSRGLTSMAQGCGLLEKLDLCECPLLTDEGMVAVATLLTNLLTLSIDSCRNVGNGTLKAFGAHALRLESISIVGCPLVGDEGLPALGDLPNLKRLKLARVSSDLTIVLENVKHAKKLAVVSLDELPCALPNEQKQLIKDCGALGSCVPRLREFGLQCFNLRSVSLCRCSLLDDNGLLSLARGAAALESLALECCNRVSFYGLVQVLSNYSKSLKALSLVKCKGIVEPLTWAAQVPAPSCNMLETLVIEHCPSIRDGFFQWLGRACWQLHELELIGLGAISDKGLLSLVLGCGQGSPSLDRVYMSGCTGLTDLSVFCIASVFGEELRSLGLGDCQGVSSRCMEVISACCPKLVDLDLSRCKITDDELVYLDRIHGLMGLNLKNCLSLSRKALDSFERTHFECDIVF